MTTKQRDFPLHLVREAVGREETARARSRQELRDLSIGDGPGFYVAVDGLEDLAPVLYIGQGARLAKRPGVSFDIARQYAHGVEGGAGQWPSAGAAIGIALAAAEDPVVLLWPTESVDDAKMWEWVLIRCSAMFGSTPRAQGGGWDWRRDGDSVIKPRVGKKLDEIFDAGYGAKLLASGGAVPFPSADRPQ